MKYYRVFVLCIPCHHKWFASVEIGTSLFLLECPNCHGHDSFPSFVSDNYLVDLTEENSEG